MPSPSRDARRRVARIYARIWPHFTFEIPPICFCGSGQPCAMVSQISTSQRYGRNPGECALSHRIWRSPGLGKPHGNEYEDAEDFAVFGVSGSPPYFPHLRSRYFSHNLPRSLLALWSYMMTSPAVGVAIARLVEVPSLPFRDRYFASLSLIGRRAAAMGLSKTTAGA